jgi:hypothetical protein
MQKCGTNLAKTRANMHRLMVGAIVGLVAGLLIQSLRYSNLRKMNQQLEVNVAELQKQMAARETAASPAGSRPNEERLELLRLRNQAAQLRAATNELQQLRTQMGRARAAAQTAGVPGTATAELVPREAWGFVGYATPEAAFQSTIFAHSQGDFDSFLASLTADALREHRKELESKTPEEFAEYLRRETAKITGYRIVEREDISAEETVLVFYAAGAGDVERVSMRKVGNEWRMAGSAADKSKPR